MDEARSSAEAFYGFDGCVGRRARWRAGRVHVRSLSPTAPPTSVKDSVPRSDIKKAAAARRVPPVVDPVARHDRPSDKVLARDRVAAKVFGRELGDPTLKPSTLSGTPLPIHNST